MAARTDARERLAQARRDLVRVLPAGLVADTEGLPPLLPAAARVLLLVSAVGFFLGYRMPRR